MYYKQGESELEASDPDLRHSKTLDSQKSSTKTNSKSIAGKLSKQVEKFKIIHLNAQAATNKVDELALMCDELKPDVFVVTEHNFQANNINLFQINNYNLANVFIRKNQKGGGVAVFIKDGLEYEQFKVKSSCELDFEAEGIKISTNMLDKITVVGIYRSPNGCVNSFFEKFESLLTEIFRKYQHFVIIGDININALNHSDPITLRLRDSLSTFGLNLAVDSPTRVTATSSTAIDNVISNILNTTVTVFDTAISDHFAQEVVVHGCTPQKLLENFTTKRVTSEENIKELNRQLQKEDWLFLNEINCPNEKFKAFNDRFIYYLNISCPFKTKKQILKYKKQTWITRGILKSRQKLNFLHSIYIRSENEEFKIYYRNYKRIYKKVIRAAKAYDVNKVLSDSENFSKTVWGIINKTRKTSRSVKPDKLKSNLGVIDNPQSIANVFNNYFASVADPDGVLSFPSDQNYNFTIPASSMALTPVDEEELIQIVKKFKTKKSCDNNGISVWLLKKCFSNIVAPITNLLNISFNYGVFPAVLKVAKVTPIFKKDDPRQPSNYRPISILPTLSKIYEKAFAVRLQSFLGRFNILSPDQFGFRKNMSAVDAISNLIESVVEGLERRELVLSIFLDLSKAFDCVHHETLLSILHSHGIRGVPHSWITSYLMNREQYVEISNSCSTKVNLAYGVPQGSILGPLLFLIYVNHIGESIQSGKVLQYADDTTICVKSKSIQDLEINSYIALNSCIQNFSAINLKTNHSKSNVISFCLRQQQKEVLPIVMMDDTILEQTNSTNFLGMHLDRGLTWINHIDSICSRVSSGIYALRNLAKYCSIEVLRTAYFGLIYPHILYGLRLWGSCAKSSFDRVFRLQKRAIRVMLKMHPRDSCRDAFGKLGLLTLPSLYVLEVALHCKSKCALLQGGDIHNYETRNRELYRIVSHRTTAFGRLSPQIGVRIINHLPTSIKNQVNYSFFKSDLKNLLLSMAFYSVDEFMGCKWENL